MKLLLFMWCFMLFNNLFADSGGILTPEQAAYDVKKYNINLKIDPANQVINGNVEIEGLVVARISELVFDLQNTLFISKIDLKYNNKEIRNIVFTHTLGKITLVIPDTFKVGSKFIANIFYSGKPKASVNPPWDEGTVWSTSASKPFVGIACEEEGADIWFPCKDHPSDEADSVDLKFIYPKDLKCISNGKELETFQIDSLWQCTHWLVTNPINNYDITFYLASYQKLQYDYTSITGEKLPIQIWILPKSIDLAQKQCPSFIGLIKFLEETCGPYPFRSDKLGIVQAPYLGMEHQTAIAYGDRFVNNSYGFDYLFFHEFSHEWWGNLITCKDWKDIWIHEGFATYMEALIAEKIGGEAAYNSYIESRYYTNAYVAYREVKSASNIFKNQYGIYFKGATVLHGLRNIMGDDKFFKFIKKCAYRDTAMIHEKKGKQCRLVDSEEIIAIANEVMGENLNWYFEVGLYNNTAPTLYAERSNDSLKLKWVAPKNLPYNSPVQVMINSKLQIIKFLNNAATVLVKPDDEVKIDPYKKSFRAASVVLGNEPISKSLNFLLSNYPNPFNPTTVIKYSIPKRMNIKLIVFDALGREVKELVNGIVDKGEHEVMFSGSELSSGIYFYKIIAENYVNTQKMILIK